MKTGLSILLLLPIVVGPVLPASGANAAGDPERGAQQFRQCAACHSMAPGEHLTGPSLADVLGNRAGSNETFGRYSPALQDSGIVWTEGALDKWLRDPTGLVPGTSMRISGIDDETARQDIIAYLEAADGTSESVESSSAGMMGDMDGSRLMNLKELDPNQQVDAIRYCGDAYYVTLGTGKTYTFWEFNLRFKSDSSENGPPAGRPGILPSGMRGDRASVIFADPGEISGFIQKKC